MRIAHLALVTALTSFILAGCGGSDGGINISNGGTTTSSDSGADVGAAGDEDLDALLKYLSGPDELFDETESECMGKVTLELLSDDAIQIVKTSNDLDLSVFSEDDRSAIVAGLDECANIEHMVDAFAEGIIDGTGLPLTPAESTCASKEFASEFAGAGEFLLAVTEMSEDEAGTKLIGAMGACMSDESATEFFSTILQEQELSVELATCISESIVDKVGAAGLMDAISASAGGDSKPLSDLSDDVTVACQSVADGG